MAHLNFMNICSNMKMSGRNHSINMYKTLFSILLSASPTLSNHAMIHVILARNRCQMLRVRQIYFWIPSKWFGIGARPSQIECNKFGVVQSGSTNVFMSS